MTKTLWLPFQVALCLYLGDYFILWAIPDTLDLGHLTQTESNPNISRVSYESLASEHVLGNEAPESSYGIGMAKRTRLSLAWSPLLRSDILLCFVIFFLKRVAFTSESFIFQYASVRLGWELRQTAQLQFVQASGQFWSRQYCCQFLQLMC
jgi:hypothetical protein